MKPDQGMIAVEGMRFHAYHGYYQEERESGNHFEVDVYVKTDLAAAAANDSLSETVNYEVIYDIVKKVMAEKYKLLEHVAYNILKTLDEEFTSIDHARVRVSKFNLPIKGDIKRAYVELEKTFDQSHRK